MRDEFKIDYDRSVIFKLDGKQSDSNLELRALSGIPDYNLIPNLTEVYELERTYYFVGMNNVNGMVSSSTITVYGENDGNVIEYMYLTNHVFDKIKFNENDIKLLKKGTKIGVNVKGISIYPRVDLLFKRPPNSVAFLYD